MDLFDQVLEMINGSVGQTIILGVGMLVGFIILVVCIDGRLCAQNQRSRKRAKP